MSEQYDFEKQIPVIKESVVTEPKQYDFGENLNEFVSGVAKLANDAAKKGYWRNIGGGAGAGGVIGGVGGVVNNALKSDNDPTKKGTFKSFVNGAVKGAATGAVGRYAVKSGLGKAGRQSLNRSAVNNIMLNAAKEGQSIGLKGDELSKFIQDRALKSNIGLDPTQIQNIINNIL